jgi:hypothetical protein
MTEYGKPIELAIRRLAYGGKFCRHRYATTRPYPLLNAN